MFYVKGKRFLECWYGSTCLYSSMGLAVQGGLLLFVKWAQTNTAASKFSKNWFFLAMNDLENCIN
jgi:hypothetical protein